MTTLPVSFSSFMMTMMLILGCVSLGVQIRISDPDHSDHSASKETLNPRQVNSVVPLMHHEPK